MLRAFGARVGRRVLIRRGVRVHWPWRLSVGDDVWIGEDAWLLNLEQITIGNDVCVSQGALLCTGSHQHHHPTFEFDNGPIRLEPGAWVAARSVVLRGVTVGRGAVVGASAVARRDVAAGAVVTAGAGHEDRPRGDPGQRRRGVRRPDECGRRAAGGVRRAGPRRHAGLPVARRGARHRRASARCRCGRAPRAPCSPGGSPG
ncbi:hypothetical protein GCM10020295_32650 [Streptomyces cinereospinus]